MREDIQNLKNEALSQIMEATSTVELEELRVVFLGRNGKVNQVFKDIKDLSQEEKREVGQTLNEVKKAIEAELSYRTETLKHDSHKWFDPTIPGIKPKVGHLHLVTQAIEEITQVFKQFGFTRVRYPEVEFDWYSFGALNMEEGHPARDDWETFFLDTPKHNELGEMVLTPHTSSGQTREMKRLGEPPIRMINIAKCYRRQSDVSHYPMFHQFEGLVVDKGISVVHLKGTLDTFARNFFGPERKTRLRPYHFQFTEPSFEVDITCDVCNGTGLINNEKCKLCKQGWLELGGAGMVHPVVLKNGGIDPTKYSGFAFGWGVERTFMMKSGLSIPDIRLLYSSDLRFLRQF